MRSQIPDFLRTGTIKYLLVPFVSTCPKCGEPQPQLGFSCSALQRLLRGGHPIGAYCVACDEFWSVSREERRAIAERGMPPWITGSR
jgi:hypothetical protein